MSCHLVFVKPKIRLRLLTSQSVSQWDGEGAIDKQKSSICESSAILPDGSSHRWRALPLRPGLSRAMFRGLVHDVVCGNETICASNKWLQFFALTEKKAVIKTTLNTNPWDAMLDILSFRLQVSPAQIPLIQIPKLPCCIISSLHSLQSAQQLRQADIKISHLTWLSIIRQSTCKCCKIQ